MVSYVRIFKLIAMILIANIIWAQNSAETLMHNLESSGRWGDYYVLDSKRNFNLVTRDLTVDSLYFIGDKSIHDVALSNLFGNVKGSPSKNIAISRFLDISGSSEQTLPISQLFSPIIFSKISFVEFS